MVTAAPTHRPVPSDTVRFETDGLIAGAAAGGVMLLSAMIATGFADGGFITPFRWAASVIMREHALTATPIVAMLAGVLVHGAASVLFGTIFGLAASARRRFVTERVRMETSLAAFLGAIAGALIWIVDIQIVARLFYPWLTSFALGSLLLHVVGFGVPLGISFMYLRRRRERLGESPSAYPSQARPAATRGS